MPVRTKEELRSFFQPGRRPLSSHFIDVVDSFLIDPSGSGSPGDGILDINAYSKTLFVDNGANSAIAGIKGFINKPYSSIDDALVDATIGDTIVIFASGTNYTPAQMFKAGVKYFAYPGVKIVTDAIASSALFTDGSGAGVCEFYGEAEIVLAPGDKAVDLTQDGSQLILKCKSIETAANGTSFSLSSLATLNQDRPKLMLEGTVVLSQADNNTVTEPVIDNQNGIVRLKNAELLTTNALNSINAFGNVAGIYEIIGNVTTNMTNEANVNISVGHLSYNKDISVW